MARQVLPIVGAVVGAYFGGPQGAQIGYAIGSLVGNAVDPLVVKGPQIGDSRVQTSAEVFRPIYFGTACGAGNIIMAGPDIKRVFEESQGKGGGPITTEERIFKTFAIGIGDGWTGPIVGISRIWENEKLVYDTRPGSTMAAESAKYATQFTLYTGTEDQMPDEALEAIPAQFGGGAGNVSAFRGLAYIVFANKDITPWMSIPQYRFEVVTEGSSTPAVSSIAVFTQSNQAYRVTSANANTWTSPALDTAIREQVILATDETYVSIGYNSHPTYMEELGAGFQPSTGAQTGGTGSLFLGWYSATEQILLVPKRAAGLGIIKSFDKGRSYIDSSETIRVEAILHVTHVWVIYDGINKFRYSSNSALSWSSEIETTLTGTAGLCRTSNGVEGFFGGSIQVGPDLLPSVAQTSTGMSFSYPAIPDMGAQALVAICAGGIDLFTIVAAADNGHICRRPSDSNTWSEIAFVAPGRVWGISWNGRHFILGCTDEDNDESTIWISQDGITWTLEETYATGGGDRFRGVASLALSGGSVISESIDLAESVVRIHELSGQSLSKVDASDLEGRQLGGFILSGDYTGQAAIGMLGSIFMFDSPEYDKKIHHRFRGKPVVRTITDDDLVDEPDDGTREDQIEFPRKLHLEAQNTTSGYAPAKETSERESSDVRVVGELSVSAPLMFAGDAEQQANEQARTANILHKVAWEKARGKREIVVPDKFLTDVPGDAYMVNIRGRSDRMTIDRQNYVDGVLRLELSYDRASAYVSNRAGNTPSEQTPPPSTIVGATGMLVLDIPALRDEDDINSAVRYVALGPNSPSWYGAAFGDSFDGGSSYWFRMRRNAPGSVMGTLQADVADASEHYTDRTNKVRVQLDLASYSERVEALTEQQFLSERGAFALVNSSDEVEICQYMEVDDLGNGLLELSVLLRGRLNSGTFAFPAGSRFLLLETVRPLSTQSAHIGREIWHRAISYDSTGETATIDQMTFNGNSQREWPVANLLLERAGDVVTATAVPRHRFGTDVAPVQSINHIGYRWTATDGANTASGDTNSVTPSRAFNVTGWASPITVTVAQINRITGAGPNVSEEIA